MSKDNDNKKDGIVDDDRDINSFINVNNKTNEALNDFIKEAKKDRKESESLRKNSGKESSRYNREALREYLERNTRDDEERLSRKKLHNQVDQINTSLEELLKLEKSKKDDSFNFMAMLPMLTAAITAALSAANPDGMKPYQTMAKSTMGLAGAGADAIKAANAANMLKTANVGTDALKAASSAQELSKSIGLFGTFGKALGKYSDSPLMKNLVRASSGGMIIGRALEGDATGVVGEGASLALHEAAAKAKNPKQKILMTAASLGLDVGMITRDFIRASDVEKENIARKEAAEKGVEYVPNDNDISKSVIQTATMVLPAIAAMAIPILTKKIGIPDIFGGKNKKLPEGVFDAGKASGSVKPPKILKVGEQVDNKKVDLGNFKKAQPKVEKDTIVKQPNIKDLNIQKNGFSLAGASSPITNTISKAGTTGMVKAGAKMGAKALPFVGAALGVYGAASRAVDGDWVGAGLEIASGLASFVPVVGTGAAVAIQAGLAYRDHVNESAKQATEISTITKDGVVSLTEAGLATAEQSAVAGQMVKDSSTLVNDSTSKMAGELEKSNISFLDMTKTMSFGLISFTTSLGLKFTDWVFGADNVFRTAATKLSETTSNVLSRIASTLKGWFSLGGGNINDGTGANSGLSTGGVTASKNYTKGKSVSDLNKKFGSVSALYESNKGGVKTISSGKGDNGGKSYGRHQLSSKSGTMREFLNSSEGKKYKADLGKYKIGSESFDRTYRTIADYKGEQFEKDQEAFIQRTHYAPVVKSIKQKTGIQVNERGRAVQELAYSMSVQYRGLTGGIWERALGGRNGNTLSDEEIIDRVMNNRARNVETHFSKSPNNWKGLRQRIADENAIYKDMLASPHVAKGPQSKGGSPAPAANTSSKSNSKTAPAAKSTTKAKSSVDSSTKKVESKGRYDLDKMCQFAVQNAKPKSQKKCARYVREAIQAGDTTKKVGPMGDARDWGKSLPAIGWVRVADGLQKGDIAWFPTGVSGYGHVCIWTGKVWVSDFVQSSVQPSSNANLQYHIYRAKSGFSNGVAIGAPEAVIDGDDVKGINAGAEGTEGSVTEESVIDRMQNALTTGVASIGAALFDNQMARDAINYFDRVGVDPYVLDDKKDAVNMDGFNTVIKNQDTKGFKYKFGEAGVNRSTLFSKEIQRQKNADRDYLDEAGNLGGIQRQKDSPFDYLDAAGNLGGIQRQHDVAYDYLGNAGSLGGIVRQDDMGSQKKKKKKWYDRLFGGEYSDIFGSLFGAFGLGGLYNIGQGVYNADKQGTLIDFGLETLGGLATSQVTGGLNNANIDQSNPPFTNVGVNDVFGSSGGIVASNSNGLGNIFGGNINNNNVYGMIESVINGGGDLKKVGVDVLGGIMERNNPLGLGGIYKVAKGAIDTKENGGDMVTYGLNTVADILNGKIDINPFARANSISLSPSSDAASLSPDHEGRKQVDGVVSETNKAYINMKNNQHTVIPASDMPSGGMNGTTPHGSKSGVGEGLSAALVTRNPDSIFREVSIAVMKATIT